MHVLQVGQLIGNRFLVKELLGVGGMGNVALVADTYLNNTLSACKQINADILNNAGILDSFKTEATALMEMKHENIVDFRGFYQYGDIYYLLTEWVEGESLEDRLRANKLMNERDAISLIVQVLSGLRHAHEKGVLHRDIKPSNVMLTPANLAVIIDFGIAKINARAGLQTSFAARGAFTPFYASPEQASSLATTARSDIYSIGVLLYAIITGREQSVFVENSATRLTHDSVTSLPGISPALERIILKATAPLPQNRYGTAWEMAADLQTIAGVSQNPADASPQVRTPLTTTRTPNSQFDIRKKK